MLPGPVDLRKFNDLISFEGLFSVLGDEPEPPYSRLPHDAKRWGLRRLMAEEVDLLVEGACGGSGLYRRKRHRAVHHRLKIHRHIAVRCRERNSWNR